jgi:Transmembrane amino acid transporter protein
MPINGTLYDLVRTSTSDSSDDKILYENPFQHKKEDSTPILLSGTDLSSGGESAESRILNKATWASAYINLTSTVIGAGILGLPHAFASTGFVGGSFILLLCACSSAFALHFLAKCARKVQQPVSFYSVAEEALPGYSGWIDFAVAIKCYGVATSYLVVIGDLMPAGLSSIPIHD